MPYYYEFLRIIDAENLAQQKIGLVFLSVLYFVDPKILELTQVSCRRHTTANRCWNICKIIYSKKSSIDIDTTLYFSSIILPYGCWQ